MGKKGNGDKWGSKTRPDSETRPRMRGCHADAYSEDDQTILSITEQRQGQPSVIRSVPLRERPSLAYLQQSFRHQPRRPYEPFVVSHLPYLDSSKIYCFYDQPLTTRPESKEPLKEIILSGSKATVALFAPLADTILAGHENGKVSKFDVKTGEVLDVVEGVHTGEITDIQLSPDGTYFVTSSKDKTARVSRLCVGGCCCCS
jgi:WD40 repeat protein